MPTCVPPQAWSDIRSFEVPASHASPFPLDLALIADVATSVGSAFCACSPACSGALVPYLRLVAFAIYLPMLGSDHHIIFQVYAAINVDNILLIDPDFVLLAGDLPYADLYQGDHHLAWDALEAIYNSLEQRGGVGYAI